MAEIEEFLLKQFDGAIEAIKDSSLFKLSQLCEDFSELKRLIKEKTSDSTRREKLYYLNNVLAELTVLTKRHPFSPKNLHLVKQHCGSLRKLRKELQASDSQPSSPKDGSADAKDFRWSYPSVDGTEINGMKDKDMIMERLLLRKGSKNVIKAIGIVGMAGVGKTALCQLAFNNQQVKEHFLPRIWVCLSKQDNDDEDYQKEVMKRMLICLGLEENLGGGGEADLHTLLLALGQQLNGKRYLIVLDDVWNSEKSQLPDGLPEGHGGAVIITSRLAETAKTMVGEKNLHVLLPLAGEDSLWEIFKNAYQKDRELPKDREKLKAKIVGKFGGLPLVAKMMANCALSNSAAKTPC